MTRSTRTFGRALFAAAVVSALGLGTSHAFAAAAPAPSTARICDPIHCDEYCQSMGFIFGTCSSRMGGCVCY